jgi:TRAP-type mannitol/chloroaromatic compound transport system permease small subunit
MAKKRRGEDPVARLQERARWSSFTNVWNVSAAPGGPPRWVRRMIIAAFVVMAVVGLVGLLTHYW